jgi:hypothetical protein
MPNETRHLEAAASNEALAIALLENQRSYPWAIVLGFYAALHWVDSFLARSGIHPRSHAQRDVYVLNTQLGSISVAYRTLTTRSREARYELRRFTETDARSLLAGELSEIKLHVQELLSR